MSITVSLKKIELFLAGLFFLFLPTQLAYFFWPDWSYFWGIKIDFLSPAIFWTDIVFIFLWLFWFLRIIFFSPKPSFKLTTNCLFWLPILITGGLFLANIWLSAQPFLTGYRLLRWFQFSWLVVYFKKNFSSNLLKPLFFSLLLISFLAWGQFLGQRSCQGFFWWLGERFFNQSTLGIAKMSLFGRLFVRPMATFSHPNSLAGFVLLSVIIFWFFKENLKKSLGAIFYLGLAIISTVLVIAFSGAVWLALIFGLWFFLIIRTKEIYWKIALIFLSGLFALGIYYFGLVESWSVLERLLLIKNAWRLIIDRPLFGWGLGNFIPAQGQIFFSRGSFNFYQPVHNLFLLVTVEAGVLGLGIGLYWLTRLLTKINNYWRAAVLLIIFLGLFDHYWLTLQQNFLLLALVTAIALNSSKN
ncbi:MAG: O-antigen ligase family protein [Candidatus Shapirobacteria bacterium]|nr:O-antigen ligase family protein [Candidatus Shapirobacteria bacterium]